MRLSAQMDQMSSQASQTPGVFMQPDVPNQQARAEVTCLLSCLPFALGSGCHV